MGSHHKELPPGSPAGFADTPRELGNRLGREKEDG